MNTEETQCFKLIDHYARAAHACFLAEFFPKNDGRNYYLCFRPTGGTIDSPDRYASRYLVIEVEQVQSIGSQASLPDWAMQVLDSELLEFRKQHELL
jgi:hypothetical protein